MDHKPKLITTSANTSDASLNRPDVARTSAPASAAAIRQDVERAMGNASDAANSSKDTPGDKIVDVNGNILEGAQEAKEDAVRIADKVQQSGQRAIQATSAYATSAVNATGQKLREAQGRIDEVKVKANDFIQEDPIRAVVYTAIGSAVLTAALIGIFRRR
jgi:predicted translin family RNA/ssDNA-binding protein